MARELLTPTGAAILTTLGRQRSPGPLRIERIGYGAGARDNADHPNVLRLMLGQPAPRGRGGRGLGARGQPRRHDRRGRRTHHRAAPRRRRARRVGDADPDEEIAAGAGCSARSSQDESLRRAEEILFRETTTFGIRRHRVERTKLARELRAVETPFGPVRVKVGTREGKLVTASPEYEDCRRIALEKNVPLREVMDAARRAFDGERRTSNVERPTSKC